MPFEFQDLELHNGELLKLLTHNLPDMLWVKDLQGNYLYANEAICNSLLMAKNPQEAVGKNDIFFAQRERLKHKENSDWHTFGELCFNSDLVVIEQKKAMKFEEYGNVKGKLLYLEVYKAPFYDQDGNILGTVGTGRDITKLKEIQLDLQESLKKYEKQSKELELLNNELEVRVQEAIKKQKKQEQLMLRQSRQAAMGEMLESIAHQWRQPLNIIGLATANLETQFSLGSLSDEEFHKKIAIISENIKYMSTTIDDFRKFLYCEREKAAFKPKEMIEIVLNILQAQLIHYNIQIDFQPSEEFSFYGVENEFKQVLLVLLNNAIDAITQEQERGIIKKGKVSLSCCKENDKGLVKICDNGGGISKEHCELIFEPYFTTKKEPYGTGIGLYIAKNIVESGINGEIKVDRIENGTCFSIHAPLA